MGRKGENGDLSNLVLISSTENDSFAQGVARYLNKRLAEIEKTDFRDTDMKTRIGDSEAVSGKHACLIMTYQPPISERIHEAIVWTDALMSGSLNELTMVWPYFLGERQDKKNARGEPINIRAYLSAIEGVAGKQVAKLGWVTVDLHSDQCEALSMKFDNFSALPLFARHIKNSYDGNVTIVSPDIGGLKRAKKLADLIGAETPICVPKLREQSGEILGGGKSYNGGVVKGKTTAIVDDIIDSAGTLVQAVNTMRKDGAKEVLVYATHSLFNGSARENLKNLGVKVVTTDTVYHSAEELAGLNVEVIPVSYVIGEAIRRRHLGNSTRELREKNAWDIIFPAKN